MQRGNSQPFLISTFQRAIPTTDRLQRWFGLACVLVSVLLAVSMARAQMSQTQMLKEPRVRFERYFDGTVDRPFAFRRLVPWCLRAVSESIPEAWQSAADTYLAPFTQKLLPPGELMTTRPLNYWLLAMLLAGSLLGYAGCTYLTFRRLFPGSDSYSSLVPVMALVAVIPVISIGFGHVYDFTVLFLMAALLYALVAQLHLVFLGLFVVSCLNKETTLFALVAYACYNFDRLPARRFLTYTGLQVVAFVLVYGGLHYTFRDNPGSGMEFWAPSQVDWLLQRSYGDFVTFLALLAIVALAWTEKPLVLRRASWMLVPHAGLCLLGAQPGEFRDGYESLPLLAVFACRNLEILAGACVTFRAARPHATVEKDSQPSPAAASQGEPEWEIAEISNDS